MKKRDQGEWSEANIAMERGKHVDRHKTPVEMRVVTAGDLLTISSLEKAREEAKSQGIGLGILAYGIGNEVINDVSKRRHDLRAALRTIELTLAQLSDGYHFDDDHAVEKIASIRRAAAILHREAEVLIKLYTIDD